MEETDIARLTRERDEARWAATCDVCLGDPLPGTRGCICGGTGKLADTALGLREELARADKREATLRAAAREALDVLTRLADSASEWQVYALPAGIVSEVDAAKARLAGVLNG